MNTVGGTIRDGHVVLDRPVEWPEGTRVSIQIHREEDGLIDGVWPADDSLSGQAEIQRRMEENEREPVDAEAAAAFETSLKEVRDWSNALGSISVDKPS